MNNHVKKGKSHSKINELALNRWSPYVFAEKSVNPDDLKALFEAASWAPSSYNEQPWRYIVASKNTPEAYQAILNCLVQGNQSWAQHAPVLALGIVMKDFSMNGNENKAAVHDLGAASMSICIEATQRELYVHQMIGIEPEKVKELFHLPDNAKALTALAIGYPGDATLADEPFKSRDLAPRARKELHEFVFFEDWENSVDFEKL